MARILDRNRRRCEQLLDDVQAEVEIARLLLDRRKLDRAIEALRCAVGVAGEAVAEIAAARRRSGDA